eukprot:3140742-Prymnesium_polylepis.1
MAEAKGKLLKAEEDVCPPAWDSSIGWVDVKVAKRCKYELVLDPTGNFGSEKLKSTVQVTLLLQCSFPPSDICLFRATNVPSDLPFIQATDFKCERRQLHWKFGSFRVVYLMKIGPERIVAKYHIVPRGKEKDKEDVKATVRQYLLAQEFTSRFVARLKSKPGQSDLKMKYVSTDVLELQTIDSTLLSRYLPLPQSGEFVSTERCSGREFKESEGDFIKWNNNDDYIREEDGTIDPYPQALSHFSFVESKNAYLLTDVQGWET